MVRKGIRASFSESSEPKDGVPFSGSPVLFLLRSYLQERAKAFVVLEEER